MTQCSTGPKNTSELVTLKIPTKKVKVEVSNNNMWGFYLECTASAQQRAEPVEKRRKKHPYITYTIYIHMHPHIHIYIYNIYKKEIVTKQTDDILLHIWWDSRAYVIHCPFWGRQREKLNQRLRNHWNTGCFDHTWYLSLLYTVKILVALTGMGRGQKKTG